MIAQINVESIMIIIELSLISFHDIFLISSQIAAPIRIIIGVDAIMRIALAIISFIPFPYCPEVSLSTLESGGVADRVTWAFVRFFVLLSICNDSL